MTCLGARNKSIMSIYLSENYLVCFIALISSTFLAIITQRILNNFIANKFSLENLIDIPFKSFYNIPFGLIIVLFVIACLFITLFTISPLLIYRHISLADELRDE